MNRNDIFQLLDEIEKSVKGVAPTDVGDFKTHDAYVLGTFMRTVGLFEGVVTLLSRDLGVESMHLARSLFVDCLELLELESSSPVRRIGLVMGWKKKELKEQRNLYNQATRCLGENVDEVIKHIDEETDKVADYAKRNKAVVAVPGDVSNLAEKHGLLPEYWCYKLGNHMVHKSDAALVVNRKKNAEGVFTMTYADPNVPRLAGFGAFAAKSSLLASKAIANIYSWNQPSGFDSLMDTVQAILDDKAELTDH